MEEIIIHFDCTTNHYIVSFDNHGEQCNVEIQDSLTNLIIHQYLQVAQNRVHLKGIIAETIRQIALTQKELYDHRK